MANGDAALSLEKLGRSDEVVREGRASKFERNFADWQCLRYTLAVAMSCGLLLTPRLWLSGRSYLLVPVWEGLPNVPPPWDWIVLGALGAALAAIFATLRPRMAMLALVAIL